jgi:hypothetical protein
MKSYVLMILLLLGCLGAQAQTESKTLVSLNKTNLEGLTEFKDWVQFDDTQKDFSIDVEPDGLAITNPRIQAEAWQPMVMVVPDGSFDLEEGHDYIVRLTIKVPSDGTYQVNIGSWECNEATRVSVKANLDFQIVDVEFPEYKGNVTGGHVLLQLGWVEGTTVVQEVEVFEKTGYWHNGEFQEMIRDESSLYNYVQAWDEKSQKALNDLLAGKRITDDQSIIRFDEDKYYVRKDYSLPQGDYYVSDLYKLNKPNQEEKTVCIMPRIAMFQKDGFMIDDILERLGNKVKIEIGPYDSFNDNKGYFLACQMNTSEEILEALLDINVLYKSGNYGISWYYPHCLYILPNTLPDAYTYKYTEDGMKLIFEKDWSGVEYGVIDGEDDNLWEGTDEGLAITNPRMQENIWDPMTCIANEFSLEQGHDYIVRLTMKVPSDGMYQVVLYGDGFTNNSLCQVPVTASEDFQVIDVEFPDFCGDAWSDGRIMLQNGWVVGTTILKKVEILEKVSSNTVAVKIAKASKADDTIYNLAGQRVDASYKGVVIKNGKKYVK